MDKNTSKQPKGTKRPSKPIKATKRKPILSKKATPKPSPEPSPDVADPEWIRQKVVHLGIKRWNNCAVALLRPDSTSDKDV
ncbi:hypothetical protein DSO57_1008983 [Entomophthora muscae]|uniref:Uncharacterized protein n=1 Tax=Entomophthora muscae TaxID=34485 RepID=A0ACC2SVZ5_9FUNG|nr:hypothetical protein DSO57_1008983 [Entomophthora muscae]